MLHPAVDPKKSQTAQRIAVVLHQWQQSCRAFAIVFIPHPSTFRLPIQPIQQNEGKEEGGALMVLAWFLLLSRLLPAVQSRMVSCLGRSLPLQVMVQRRYGTKYFKGRKETHTPMPDGMCRSSSASIETKSKIPLNLVPAFQACDSNTKKVCLSLVFYPFLLQRQQS